jgi:hypothetical protein
MTGKSLRFGGGGATGAVELEAIFGRSSVLDPLFGFSHPVNTKVQIRQAVTMKWNRRWFTTSH